MFGFEFSPELGLAGLFLVAFLSATLLPGGSEIALLIVLNHNPQGFTAAVVLATIGNTLGGMTSYGVGRLLPAKVEHQAIALMKKHGYPALLFSWLPLVGDAFCVGAGWLRMNWLWVVILLAVGKFGRYLVVADAFTCLKNFL